MRERPGDRRSTGWSTEFGFELPAPAPELAVQVIALLLGAAFQYRLEPAAVTEEIVVDGLRRLLGLRSRLNHLQGATS